MKSNRNRPGDTDNRDERGGNKRKQPGSNNDQTQTKGDKDIYTREQGTQVRTLKGRSDNETQVKIVRQRKKAEKQEQEVKVQKIQGQKRLS